MYYVYTGTCPNKSAYDLYCEYLKAADGYCYDELQEEVDGTWTIFTRLDFDDWIDYPFELRYQKFDKEGILKIWKNDWKKASESLSASVAKSDTSEAGDIDEDEYNDLLCYEALN